MAKQELKKISQEELDEILEQHFLWLKSKEQEGICADLSFCDLRDLIFPEQTWLSSAIFTGANIEGVNLKRANCEETLFNSANLQETDFREANLQKANFQEANLQKVNFQEAKMSYADFLSADLRQANFEEAIINKVNFQATDLRGANFSRYRSYGDTLNFKEAYLDDKTIGLDHIKQNNQIEEIRQQKLQLENELAQAKAEKNQSQEQQNKILKLEDELKQAKQKEQEFEISKAHGALTTALTNTEAQIENNKRFSEILVKWALLLIVLDVIYITIMPFTMVFNAQFYTLIANKVGMWGILFLTFPALMILLIALALLRHQKQLIAEIRHYSMLKHKIELYGGILKAAQYTASSVMQSQNSEAAKYIQETFNEIKVELLKSPNFDLNAQPHIFPEEGGNLLEMFKSTTELVKASTETSKAAAEIVKKATTSEK